MKLHFLGTTGYHPNNHRQTACLMLPEIGVILDAGTGMFRVRDLIATDTLDIFLSHTHLDHSIGLTFMYDVLFQRPLKRVTVHLEGDKVASIREHLFSQALFPVPPNFEINTISAGQNIKLCGSASLTPFSVEHPGGCLGFRIDGLPGGKSIAYVTDTTAEDNAPYIKSIASVDTLVHECYFPDGWEDRAKLTGHSCLTPVARVAKAARVKHCYLVHVNPLDENKTPLDLGSVRDIFGGIEVANDQQIIEV